MYVVTLTRRVEREIRKLSPAVQIWILDVLEALALDPRPHGVKKLAGFNDVWRLRAGDYRVIYRVSDEELVVTVVRAGHRREVYRRLP